MHRTVALTPLSDVSAWCRTNLLLIIALILGTILVTRLATWLSTQIAKRVDVQSTQEDALVRSEATKHQRALIQVITWTFLVLIYCLAAVLLVRLLGIPITGFVAPATVVGVALGFGAQRVVQDLLAGFFLVAERQYGFGDVVKLTIASIGSTGVVGTVEEVTLRITRVRTIDGEVITTPNGQIVQVTNLSRDWARAVVDVPVPVSADVNRVTEVLKRVCAEAYADESLHELMLDAPSVMGVESLQVDQFNVRVVARTLPAKQFDVARALRARITEGLLGAGIMVAAAIDTGDATGTPQ